MPEIAKLDGRRPAHHLIERQPARKRHAGQRPGAGPDNAIDGDLVLLERVQYAQVRDAARKPAAQRHAHLRLPRGPAHRRSLGVRKFAHPLHRAVASHPIRVSSRDLHRLHDP